MQESQLKHRVLLLGDAGLSTISPRQPSLQKVIERAKGVSDQTSVIMLGDNIYPNGFPNKTAEQNDFNPEQLEDISHLKAQLEVSRLSKAEMFLVPGNHDWYASQVDSQASYIASYSKKNNTKVSFVPYEENKKPLPQVIHRDGISLIFIDSMWLLEANKADFSEAMSQLDQLLQQSNEKHPENVIMLFAHHPIETMGPHGGYYAKLGYEFYAKTRELINGQDTQDLDSLAYQRLINGVKLALTPYKKTIFAAGHDHSLQLFKNVKRTGAQYSLVSGAANTKKLTDVGNNENTQFASSVEGLFEIDVLDNGVLLRIYDIYDSSPIHQQWLWKKGQE